MQSQESLSEIRTGLNPTDSEIFLIKLREEGIPAEIVDTNATAALPHYAFAFVGVKVVVPQQYAQKTRELLQEHYDQLNHQQEETSQICPQCKSDNTVTAKSNILTNLFGFLTLLPTRVAGSKRRVCKDCGYKW